MKTINYLALSIILFCVTTAAIAQKDTEKRPSPPATAMNQIGDLKVKISYSQPSVKGRAIFGELVPFDKVWRTGANEATTIEFSTNAKINGEKVAEGKYALFTIPGESEWVVILNSANNQWGAYNYDKEKDVMRFTVKSEKGQSITEKLTFEVMPSGEVTMKWADTMIKFMVSEES